MRSSLDEKAIEFSRILPREVHQLFNILKTHDKESLIIGGAVRDFFFGVPIGDFDLATSATPNQLIQWLKDSNIKTKSIGGEFGTVLAIMGKKAFDVSTFRREHFHAPGKPPIVTFVKSLADDLARRDFTINAIVYDDADKKIYDPYDGLRDIRERVIHIIGDPFIRFLEDGLRIIRICRFISQFNLNPGEAAHKAVYVVGRQALFRSRTVVRQEFFKLLKLPYPERGLRLLYDAEVLKAIFPHVPIISAQNTQDYLTTVFDKLKIIPTRQPLIRLFSFLVAGISSEHNSFHAWKTHQENITQDLNLNQRQQQVLRRLVDGWFSLPNFEVEREVRQWIRKTGLNTSEDLLPALFLLSETFGNNNISKDWESVRKTVTRAITSLRSS
ncbi:MAG: CCA tRNA nucleotidyltransferase [Candidatus Heimdallarchaeota archaeon]